VGIHQWGSGEVFAVIKLKGGRDATRGQVLAIAHELHVLQACANATRGLHSVASAAASVLKGKVTLQPLPPADLNA
jgi:hypothetical protein